MALSRTGHTAAATGGRGDRLSREILVLSAVVILGTIMTVLDLTIVNVAIPTLGSDLRASIPAIQWVLTGYMLGRARRERPSSAPRPRPSSPHNSLTRLLAKSYRSGFPKLLTDYRPTFA